MSSSKPRVTPGLMPQDETILARLTRAAAAGGPCPTNHEIMDALGASSPSTACSIMAKLERRGFITVERFYNARRVTIVTSGQQTVEIKGKPRRAGSARPASRRRKAIRKPAAQMHPCAKAAGVSDLALIEHLRVERDACFYCGTRSDVGCRHTSSPSSPACAAGAPVGVPPLAPTGAFHSLVHGEPYAR